MCGGGSVRARAVRAVRAYNGVRACVRGARCVRAVVRPCTCGGRGVCVQLSVRVRAVGAVRACSCPCMYVWGARSVCTNAHRTLVPTLNLHLPTFNNSDGDAISCICTSCCWPGWKPSFTVQGPQGQGVEALECRLWTTCRVGPLGFSLWNLARNCLLDIRTTHVFFSRICHTLAHGLGLRRHPSSHDETHRCRHHPMTAPHMLVQDVALDNLRDLI